MRLSKHKLEAIIAALKLARDTGENDDRQRVLEALHWAQEVKRERAKAKEKAE